MSKILSKLPIHKPSSYNPPRENELLLILYQEPNDWPNGKKLLSAFGKYKGTKTRSFFGMESDVMIWEINDIEIQSGIYTIYGFAYLPSTL